MKLNHKVSVYRETSEDVNGMMTFTWAKIAEDIRCFVDVAFLRPGIDPTWTPQAGRPVDRTGVAFFFPSTEIQPGDIIKVAFGPEGQFRIRDTNKIWTPTRASHIEAGLEEVSGQLTV